ncbi:MAG: hypothetical protein WCN99_06790 [bacterium]
MPETKQLTFSHQEIAEALIRYAGLKEGLWGLYVEFGILGTNVTDSSSNLNPAAIVPILKLGLQRFPKGNNLTADAAKVNQPVKKKASK